MISRTSVSLVTISVGLLLCLLHGCAEDPRQGWSTSSVYSTKYKTIAVNVFENETYSREIGYLLTQAVIATIESQTPYKVTSATNADTLLTGEITRVQLTTLSQNRTKGSSTGLDEEVVVGVTISFNWTDLETDRTIIDRTDFSGGGLFVPTSQSRETLELGEIGVVQQLADDLVDEMQAVW
jgi:hypothetical protein